VANIRFGMHAIYSFIEPRNARNLMKALHARGEISSPSIGHGGRSRNGLPSATQLS
jgi:hypothetical protein